jgi:hypothetical protein
MRVRLIPHRNGMPHLALAVSGSAVLVQRLVAGWLPRAARDRDEVPAPR